MCIKYIRKLCACEPLQSINQYHNTIKRYKVKQSSNPESNPKRKKERKK